MDLYKCLVVDDDEMGRELIAQYLEGIVECSMAENGNDAVAMFQKAMDDNNPYDLIIMDILMPGMNGHEAGREIRRIEKAHGIPLSKQVKLIVLSSLSTPQDVMQSFMATQSAAHLVKPVEPAKLKETLGKLGLRKR